MHPAIILARPRCRPTTPAHGFRRARPVHQGTGAGNSASRRSASPASTCPRTKSTLGAWLAQRRHGTMHLHAAARHAPDASRRIDPGHVARDQRAHGLPGRGRTRRGRARRRPNSATSRVTHSAATTTRCCAAGSPASRNASRRRRAASGYRAFTDSAPVMEKALARDAGLGWIGKHTNLLDRHDGSWFFLGEIYTDLPLPLDAPVSAHCGSCTACIDVCPTQAIVAPYELDARRCISYLTIEDTGPDPGAVSRGHGQSHLRLRRLPARVPVESLREIIGGAGFPDAPRTRRATPRRPVRVEQRRIPEPHRRQRDPTHRLRTLVAQRGRRARQRADDGGSRCTRCESRRDSASELVREHVEWAWQQHAARGARSNLRGGSLRTSPGPRHCRLSISRALPRRPAASTTRSRSCPSGRARRSAVRTSK